MNRTFSTLTVLAMLLAAVGLCAKQTFDGRELVDPRTALLLYAAEALGAGLVVGSAVTLHRNRSARQRRSVSRRRPVPATV